jgi:penicillin-binding protein 1A
MKKVGKKISVIVLIIVSFPALFLLVIYFGAFGILQSEKELQSFKNATATQVLSLEGELIGKVFTENRTNITFSQIPPHLIDALVATEDARFFEHKGIDSRSLFRVFFKTIIFNRPGSGGGSTITQQLAKNMFGRRNKGLFSLFINKTKEAMLAHRLERAFTKDEILTLYLNTVPFGENVYGIGSAALRYFNKKTESLNIEESAVLVGLLKANNLYNPRLFPENAKKRRNLVIRQMQKYAYLTKFRADSLTKLPLALDYSNLESAGPADYFVFHVKNEARQILDTIYESTGKKWNIEQDGLVITTTLNLKLQEFAKQSIHDHLSVMQKRLNIQYQSYSGRKFISQLAENELKAQHLTDRANETDLREVFDWNGTYTDSLTIEDSLVYAIKLLHAGIIAVDPVTGAIKAWVGGNDFKSQPFDQILARRQMGSTFKPILYATALESGIKPCYYLDNDSIIVSGNEDWSPKNFDHSVGGKYSLTGALIHSMNIPTFNLYLKLGFGKLDSIWKEMGFSFVLNDRPSVAMGTAEANLEEVALAYSVFANGGFVVNPQYIVSIKSSDGQLIWQHEAPKPMRRILSPTTCMLLDEMLQKAVREGTGSPVGSMYGVTVPLAGKTGTTQDYADAWFAAFNPGLVVVSRVGASLPSVHFRSGSNGAGSALALPLVAMTLKKVQMDPVLKRQFLWSFRELPPELRTELECPDYRERNVLENFVRIFRRDRIDYDKATKKEKRPSFFKRLFGSKK